MRKKQAWLPLAAAVSCVLLSSPAIEAAPKRPDKSPEDVINRPLAEVLPSLVGATRIGNWRRLDDGLAYWPYRLADGTEVRAYLCLITEEDDCAARALDICQGAVPINGMSTVDGTVLEVKCEAACYVDPLADGRPCCQSGETTRPLAAGVVKCD